MIKTWFNSGKMDLKTAPRPLERMFYKAVTFMNKRFLKCADAHGANAVTRLKLQFPQIYCVVGYTVALWLCNIAIFSILIG